MCIVLLLFILIYYCFENPFHLCSMYVKDIFMTFCVSYISELLTCITVADF